MGKFFDFLIAIWNDNWRDRMFFIIGIVLSVVGFLPVFNKYLNLHFLIDLDKGYNLIALIAGLIVLFFVAKDWRKKYKEIKRVKEISESAIKIFNYLNGHIINNNLRWNIRVESNGAIISVQPNPLCPKPKCIIGFTIPTGNDYKCPNCGGVVVGKDLYTERQLAENELNKKIDEAKKELE